MSVTIYVDEPGEGTIEAVEFTFRGWIASDPGSLSEVSFHTVNDRLRVEYTDRPDVRQALPQRDVMGFNCRITLRDHLHSMTGCTLRVFVWCNSGVAGSFTFRTDSRTVASCVESSLLC